MPHKNREERRTYTRFWVYEKRQSDMEKAYLRGSVDVGFCDCGNYYKIPKIKRSKKCLSCRKGRTL